MLFRRERHSHRTNFFIYPCAVFRVEIFVREISGWCPTVTGIYRNYPAKVPTQLLPDLPLFAQLGLGLLGNSLGSQFSLSGRPYKTRRDFSLLSCSLPLPSVGSKDSSSCFSSNVAAGVVSFSRGSGRQKGSFSNFLSSGLRAHPEGHGNEHPP